jgi:hypothetical protein
MQPIGQYLRTASGRAILFAVVLILFAGATAFTGCTGAFAPTHAIVKAERTTTGITIRATVSDSVNGYHFALPAIPIKLGARDSVPAVQVDTVPLQGLDSAGAVEAIGASVNRMLQGGDEYYADLALDAARDPARGSFRTGFTYESEQARRAWRLPPIRSAGWF